MAHVASCPQCQQEFLVPQGTNSDAWAKCPECRAFFQLNQTTPRELPALLVVESAAQESDTQLAATSVELPAAPAPSEPLTDPQLETRVEDVAAETVVSDSRLETELEAAADRIDKWFRSAQTVPETLPIAETETREWSAAPREIEPAESEPAGRTVEFNANPADEATAADDIELDFAPEPAVNQSPWDDAQHMERLLADIEPPHQSGATAAEPRSSTPPPPSPAPDSSENKPFVTPAVRGAKQKRSLVRTLVLTAAAGVIGIALGAYALLWLRGESGDLLNVAQFLPPAILPAEFQTRPKPASSSSPEMAASKTDSTPSATDANGAADNAAEPDAVQAVHTEVVEATEPNQPAAGAEGSPLDASAAPPAAAEPAELDSPEAAPLAGNAAPITTVEIAGAPSFTATELSAALAAAKDAVPKLTTGSLADGKEVQQAKGRGYMALADLAQHVTFAAAIADPASDQQSQRAADELFRAALADRHTQQEVAQILPRWIASSNRKHGGIFFASTLTRLGERGPVTEWRAELDGGQSLTVLSSAPAAGSAIDTGRPVAVVGWIVERPAEQILGYTGGAAQAIWAGRFVPLE